ncbi:TRAP transporter substrate-binding protein DctP [Frigidibacter oleivorans]|uniref:TRAP transporter substrate-binding protein DctP n=1 Tax=Frigidibacter oleivorans TaxID=2487129 RepID=UPI000F8CDD8F|nr:TRAP transporter substrate-binding protein DctP [Frigidibacter oleivorans]
MMDRRDFFVAGLGAGLVLAAPAVLRAEPVRLKCSSYLPPMHQINAELARWAADLGQASDGQLLIEVFPGGQMGPPPRQLDLVRTGIADFAFVYTALYPGRFPVTDLLARPFALADAEGEPISSARASWVATSLADVTAAEYPGCELLYSVCSTATGFYMKDVLVRRPEDLAGLRIRPTSGVVAEQLKALGASPATIAPTELADAIAKGVVDGAVFNFEGGKAFQLQQSVRRVSTIANSAATFSLVANGAMIAGLPAELAALLRDSGGPEAGRRVGGLYDTAEAAGRSFMAEAGVEIVDLRGPALEPFRAALAPAGAAQLAALGEAEAAALVARIDALMAEA